MPVSKDQAMTAQTFSHVSMVNKQKQPVQVRRNGKTQTWKTRPNEFKIPVKFGLYEHFYITHENCDNWNANE